MQGSKRFDVTQRSFIFSNICREIEGFKGLILTKKFQMHGCGMRNQVSGLKVKKAPKVNMFLQQRDTFLFSPKTFKHALGFLCEPVAKQRESKFITIILRMDFSFS